MIILQTMMHCCRLNDPTVYKVVSMSSALNIHSSKMQHTLILIQNIRYNKTLTGTILLQNENILLIMLTYICFQLQTAGLVVEYFHHVVLVLLLKYLNISSITGCLSLFVQCFGALYAFSTIRNCRLVENTYLNTYCITILGKGYQLFHSTLTFVLQRVVGDFALRALFQISIVQDFMVRRQTAIPKLIWRKT